MKARIFFAVLCAVLTLSASANERFRREHPRRAEVNGRLRHEENRVQRGVASGKITPDEAATIEKERAAIKREERADVKANGGHLTREQQRHLNQEENAVSKEIRKDMHN